MFRCSRAGFPRSFTGKDACGVPEALYTAWIILGTDLHNTKLSAPNVLCGTISRLHDGAVNSELILTLPGGDTLTSIITKSSVEQSGTTKCQHLTRTCALGRMRFSKETVLFKSVN